LPSCTTIESGFIHEEEPAMNLISQDLERQVLHSAMHQKILLRAAELIEQGWTRGTAARAADGQKVRSTSPTAISWCVVGAVDRALHELLNIDVYDLLGLEIDAYDTAPCPAGVMLELRRPLRRILGRAVAGWNDRVCRGPAAAARLLREAAEQIGQGEPV
jgi:hypothetical protein